MPRGQCSAKAPRQHGFANVTELDTFESTDLGPSWSPPHRRSTGSPRSPSCSKARADLTRTLRPRLAVPIHYAFTRGPLRDKLLLKMDTRPEVFVDAAADLGPDTEVHVLDPGPPLTI